MGVTQTGHLELPPKLPRKCPAAPDPRRSLAPIVCRPIRVRYTCFSGVLTRMPSLPDRYRPSPNIANWWARSDSIRGPRDSIDLAVSGGSGVSLHPGGVRDALA